MKKSIATWAHLLALMVVFCAVGGAQADTETVDGITWTYAVSDGKASVGSGSYSGDHAVPTSTEGAITIPSTLGGCPVTSIGDYAFYWCSGLTSVTIPDGVTSIGYGAFYACSGLTAFVVSEGNPIYKSDSGLLLTKDGTTLVAGVNGAVEIPYGVTSIGEHAFSGCIGLTSVTIPDSVTSIEDYAFSECLGLTSVTIGNSVTSIGELAFFYCSKLVSVIIPDSVMSIGYIAFEGCTNLYDTTTITGVKLVDGWAVGYTDSIPADLDLSGVRGIVAYAFYNCSGLTSVTIPDSVTSIGECAFYNCSGLASVTIPDSVTSIGYGAFGNCFGLKDVTVPQCVCDSNMETVFPGAYPSITNVVVSAGVTSIGEGVFYKCSGLTSVTLPDSVTSIGGNAFSGCSGLTSVTIPNSVTSIRMFAFAYCSGLTAFEVLDGNQCYKSDSGLLLTKDGTTIVAGVNGTVAIPDGVTSIGGVAFYGCSGLTSVTIPDSVTSIGLAAFRDCSDLTNVMIPASVTNIGRQAFRNCSDLTSVIFEGDAPEIGEDAFAGIPSNCVARISRMAKGFDVDEDGKWQGMTVEYYGPKFTIDEKGVLTGVKLYEATSVIIPDTVTSIGDRVFAGCYGLTSVMIPDSVTSIGSYAFYLCSGLTSVTIGNSVTSIGSSAFAYCYGLTSVMIPDRVTSIGSYAFYLCSGLTSVTIGNSVTSIGSSAFAWCYGLTSVTIPDSVTSIKSEAFYRCYGLTSVTIPNSVTSIGRSAFDGCNASLFDTTTISGVNLVDGWVVGTTDSLSGNLDLAGVRGIGGSAFRGCSGLTSVTIPDSVTSIGEYAFYNCSGLTSVTIPASVTGIGAGAFAQCSNLTAFEVAEDNQHFMAIDGVLYSKDSKTLVSASGAITNIEIPDSVTSIGSYALYGCSWLTSVAIPDGVASIGYGAFAYCGGLTSVTIPDSVTNIGEYAFQSCSGLTSVTIPDSVTSIGEGAFAYCSVLNRVIFEGDAPEVGTNAFAGIPSNCVVRISRTAQGFTIDADGRWNGLVVEYENEFIIDENGVLTGVDLHEATSVVIPDAVTSIGEDAFSGCSGLASVTIPDSVTYIGPYAFRGCSGLTSVTIPDSVTSIEYGAFYGCSGLKSVTIPDSLTSINMYTFDGCHSDLYDTTTIPGVQLVDGWVVGYTEVKGALDLTGARGIGAYAFSDCSGITSVMIPDNVTSIGYYAFYNCSGLTSATIGNSVTSIGLGAFRDCIGLKSVTMPDSVTSIGYAAFYCCSGLTSVTIPGSVTNIGTYAFRNCSGLTSVIFEGDAPEVGTNAFAEIPSDCIVRISRMAKGFVVGEDGKWQGMKVEYYGPKFTINANGVLTGVDLHEATSVVIPDAVTCIGDRAFEGCTNLVSVTIPASVTSIGNYAFYGCSSLKSIVIPDSVTSLGNGLFWECGGLISVRLPAGIGSIGASMFCKCPNLASVNIPDCVTSIGDSAFAFCSGLTDLTIPDGVTSLGNAAFAYCSGLTSVTIPEGLTSIANYGFQTCSGLKSVTIPDNITSIGKFAFASCHGLASITISGSVTSIGERAFRGCSVLANVIFEGDAPEVGEEAFAGIPSDCVVHISRMAKGFDIDEDGKWQGMMVEYYGPEFTINENGVLIGVDLHEATSVVIPDAVTRIGEKVFYDCSTMVSVTIPDSVTSIEYMGFYNCTGLTSVTIGNGVTSIGEDAFSGCSGLTSVTIPDSVTNIGLYAFGYCSGLTSVTIPNSVTSIGNGAFCGCRGLASVTIPDSVTSIGASVFSGCHSNLYDTTTIPGVRLVDGWVVGYTEVEGALDLTGARGVGSYAFYECSGLASVTIGNGVTSIGGNAFDKCSGLTSVTIQNSVTNIGSWAFEYCSGLASVMFEGDAPEVGTDAFAGIPSDCVVRISRMANGFDVGEDGKWQGMTVVYYGPELTINANGVLTGVDLHEATSVVIPDAVTRIGEKAFYECSGLTSVTIPDSVTSIGEKAFYECSGLTSVTIPNCMTNIGYGAFMGCSSLANVAIPDSVTSIGSYAFYKCSNFVTVVISANIANIGSCAFAQCSNLTAFEVAEGNQHFMAIDGVLYSKDRKTLVSAPGTITNIEIPDNVISIVAGAFEGCSRLTAVNIPDGVTKINDSTFLGCSSLASVRMPDGVTSIGHAAFYECGNLKDINMPSALKRIEGSAFYSCPNLVGIELPDGLKTICYQAFSYCSKLTSMTIPDSVTTIEESAFMSCNGITSITMPDTITSIERQEFFGCRSLKNFVIPEGVRSIAKFAFYDCKGFTSLVVPSNVTSVGTRAFMYCTGLQSIYLPVALRDNIPEDTFKGCSDALQVIYYESEDMVRISLDTVGGSLASPKAYGVIGYPIGELPLPKRDGFFCVGWYTSAEGGDEVSKDTVVTGEMTLYAHWVPVIKLSNARTDAEIWDGTAINESNLDFMIPATEELPEGATLRIRRITLASLNASFNSTLSTSCCDPYYVRLNGVNSDEYEFVGTIASNCEVNDNAISYTFSSPCEIIVGKNYPAVAGNSIGGIGDGIAFLYNNGKLIYGTVNGVAADRTSVRYVKTGDATSIMSTTTAESITGESGYYPVYEIEAEIVSLEMRDVEFDIDDNGVLCGVTLNGHTEVTIPDNVTSIGAEAFCDQAELESVTIPNSVTNIGDRAFYHCVRLSSVTIPDSVKSLGADAFHHCEGLREVNIGNGVRSFGYYAFGSCVSLVRVTIPEGVTSLPMTMFYDCYALESVELPSSLTQINYFAFGYCTNLSSVTMPDSVTLIGDESFKGCSSLASVIFEGDAPKTGRDVFAGVAVGCTAYVLPDSTGWSVAIPGSWDGIDIDYYGMENYNAVAVDLNGGALLGDVDCIYVRKDGVLVTLPEPSRKGYKFLGWFTEEIGGQQIEVGAAIAGDMILHAHWLQLLTWSNTGSEAEVWDGTAINESNLDFMIPATDDLPNGTRVRIRRITFASLNQSFTAWDAATNKSDPYYVRLNGVNSEKYEFGGTIASGASTTDNAISYKFSTPCYVTVGKTYPAVAGNSIGGVGNGIAFLHSNNGGVLVYGTGADRASVRYVKTGDAASIMSTETAESITGTSGYYPVYSIDAEIAPFEESLALDYTTTLDDHGVKSVANGWLSGFAGEHLQTSSIRLGPDDDYSFALLTGNGKTPYQNVSARTSVFSIAFYADVSSMSSTGKAVMAAFGRYYANAHIALLYREGDYVRFAIGNVNETFGTAASVEARPGYHLYVAVCNPDTGDLTLYRDTDDVGHGTPGWKVTLGSGFQIGSVYEGLPSGFSKGVNMAVAKVLGYDAMLTVADVATLSTLYPAVEPVVRTVGYDDLPAASFTLLDGQTLNVRLSTVQERDGCGCDVSRITVANGGTLKFVAADDSEIEQSKIAQSGGVYTISSTPIPALPVTASVEEVAEMFAGSTDKDRLGESIRTVAEYNAYRAWAKGIEGGVDAVVLSEHAADSYLLGAESLLENEPTVEFSDVDVGGDSGDESEKGAITLSVTVKDGDDAVKVAEAKVAEMFEATSDIGDWDGEAKLTPEVDVLEGNGNTMRFKVKPGDGTATRAFLRIRK